MSSAHPTDRHVYDRAANLADLYRLVGEVYADRPALAWKESGEYRTLSYRELYERGAALGTALIGLGLQAREHVALLADNRPEWLICDFAILLCGAADVPRAADVTAQEISFIVAHSDSVMVIAENPSVLAKVLQAGAIEGPNEHRFREQWSSSRKLTRANHTRHCRFRQVDDESALTGMSLSAKIILHPSSVETPHETFRDQYDHARR